MRSLRLAPAALLLLPLLSVGPARADVISLYYPGEEWRGAHATGISADGEVTLWQVQDEDFPPLRHTSAGSQLIPVPHDDGVASGASADGSVIVGGTVFIPWKSVNGGAVQPLPVLPGGEDEQFPAALDVNADGSVIVGATAYGAGSANQAVRWTSSGIEPLGFLDGDLWSVARAISANGSVIAGTSGDRAAAWLSGAPPVALGDLPGGGTASDAVGVSADGSTIVGYASSATGFEAFRWTQAEGMVGLGLLPGATFSGASDASADGTWIVGGSGGNAFIWHASFGMKPLHDFLVDDWGLSIPDGWVFSSATAISDDGTAIVGAAYDPSLDADVGFIATIPEPATALLLAAALAALGNRRASRAV